MYLAEDRILCFEIVTKKREAWVSVSILSPARSILLMSVFSLKYVKSAKAATDVPTTVGFHFASRVQLYTCPFQIPEFISQRRRWLNGSLFASVHATTFFWRIWTSGHNPIRMFILQVSPRKMNCIQSHGVLSRTISCSSSLSITQSSSCSPGRLWPISISRSSS